MGDADKLCTAHTALNSSVKRKCHCLSDLILKHIPQIATTNRYTSRTMTSVFQFDKANAMDGNAWACYLKLLLGHANDECKLQLINCSCPMSVHSARARHVHRKEFGCAVVRGTWRRHKALLPTLRTALNGMEVRFVGDLVRFK